MQHATSEIVIYFITSHILFDFDFRQLKIEVKLSTQTAHTESFVQQSMLNIV